MYQRLEKSSGKNKELTDCPVRMGIAKAAEGKAKLALPSDITILVSKTK